MKPTKTKIFAIVLAFIISLALAACSDSNNNEGQAKTPPASAVQKGENYQDVIDAFDEGNLEYTRETLNEISFDVPAEWRKETQGSSGFFFYPTNNNLDGSLYIGGSRIDEGIPNSLDAKRTMLESVIDYKDSENFVRNEAVEYDLEIAGCYAIKSFSIWEDYNCLYYYILTDYNIYLIGIDIYENSPVSLEDVLVSVIDSVTFTIENSQPNNQDEIENFPMEYAVRAAVVTFTNWFADNDIYTEDGNDFDISKFRSYADVSGDFMRIKFEGTWKIKNENTWHVEHLILESYEYQSIYNVSLDVSCDGDSYIVTNLTGKTQAGEDWSIWEGYNEFSLFAIVPLELIKDDRIDSEVDAREEALKGMKFDSYLMQWKD